jgi:uncharacterized membrane protein
MNEYSQTFAKRIFRAEWERLSRHERDVIEQVLHRVSIPRDINKEFADRRTFGERAADVIAAFGGSWKFILMLAGSLVIWALLNTEILGPRNEAFDPYPYVFLNVILSMLAAIQAPILMMSQNRQSAHVRLEAEIDHEVNVRAELAIRQVDERLHAIERRLLDLPAMRDREPRHVMTTWRSSADAIDQNNNATEALKADAG